MARGRMINQTIDLDPEFNALSIEAQLMYLRTLAFLDRDGLIIGHPRGLLSRVAPLMEDMQPHMQGIMDEWVGQGLVIRYRIKIGEVLFFKGFGKNQSGMHYDRESPSRFEPPPGWTHGPKGLVKIDSGTTPTQAVDDAQTDSGTTPAKLQQDSGESPTQIEVKDQDQDQELQGDDDDTHAREPLAAAWFETYGDEMPEKLRQPLAGLVVECGETATIHGIRQSIHAKSRSFKFIAECARNYIPPPPTSNSYRVEGVEFMPGVYPLAPPAQSNSPPPLPPPMPHDDPWSILLAELLPTLSSQAQLWLKDSRLSDEAALAGEPFYQVLVTHPNANLQWLARTEPVIRRKLCSLLGKRVNIGFVAAPVPTIHAA